MKNLNLLNITLVMLCSLFLSNLFATNPIQPETLQSFQNLHVAERKSEGLIAKVKNWIVHKISNRRSVQNNEERINRNKGWMITLFALSILGIAVSVGMYLSLVPSMLTIGLFCMSSIAAFNLKGITKKDPEKYRFARRWANFVLLFNLIVGLLPIAFVVWVFTFLW